MNRASDAGSIELELHWAKCYEDGLGIQQNFLLAIQNYEIEITRNDLTGYARESISRLKEQEMEKEVLKEIGTWYASIKSKEAAFWLNRASDAGSIELDYYYGLLYFDSKQFDHAMTCFLTSLNFDPVQSLKAIDVLEHELSMNAELNSKIYFDIASAMNIGEAHLIHGNIYNAAFWFIKVAKLGSLKAKRRLREMVGKKLYKSALYIIGEYFEEIKENEVAMKCYKRSNPINDDEDDIEISPWEYKDADELDDGYISPENIDFQYHSESYLPLEMQKPITTFFQSSIQYILESKQKDKVQVFFDF